MSKFIRFSSLIFLINNLGNALNYMITIYVITNLEQEYGLWISITAFLAILSVPTTGLMSFLSQKFASLVKQTADTTTNADSYRSYVYHNQILAFFQKHWAIWLLAATVLYLSTALILRLDNFFITFLIVLSIGLSVFSNLNLTFLLSVLDFQRYVPAQLCAIVIKVVGIFALVELKLGVLSLPLALALSALLSLGLSTLLIRQKYAKEVEKETKEAAQLKPATTQKPVQKSTLPQIPLGQILQSIIYLAILAILLNTDIIMARTFLSDELNKQYALISTFGQMAHFGAISFASLIIPMGSQSKNKNILILSCSFVVGLGLLFSLIFGLFGDILLAWMNKSQFSFLESQLAWYGLFIMCYNLIYINVNFAISKLNFKPIWTLSILSTLYLIGLGILARSEVTPDLQLQSMINFSLVSCLLMALLSLWFNFRQNP